MVALKKGGTFEDLKDLLEEGLKEPWDKYSLRYCYEQLRQTDIERGAWMNEDGGGPAASYHNASASPAGVSMLASNNNNSINGREVAAASASAGIEDDSSSSSSSKVARVALSFVPADTGVSRSVVLMLRGAISGSVCIATSGQDTWFISRKPVEQISDLENERYDLERVPEGKTGAHEIYRACSLKLESLSIV